MEFTMSRELRIDLLDDIGRLLDTMSKPEIEFVLLIIGHLWQTRVTEHKPDVLTALAGGRR